MPPERVNSRTLPKRSSVGFSYIDQSFGEGYSGSPGAEHGRRRPKRTLRLSHSPTNRRSTSSSNAQQHLLYHGSITTPNFGSHAEFRRLLRFVGSVGAATMGGERTAPPSARPGRAVVSDPIDRDELRRSRTVQLHREQGAVACRARGGWDVGRLLQTRCASSELQPGGP